MRRTALSLLLLLSVVACAPKPALHVTKAGPAKLISGWSEATSDDSKVRVGVVPGWRHGIDRVSGDSIAGSMDSSADPAAQQFANQLDQQMQAMDAEREKQALDKMAEKGILLHIINGGRPVFDETRTRYVVQRFHQDANWNWDDAVEKERHEYGHMPKREEVTLPIGKAVKLSSSDELRNGSTIHRISYLAIEGNDLYVLRFATEEPKETIASIAKDVAESWRISG